MKKLAVFLASWLALAGVAVENIRANFTQTITNDQNKTITYTGKVSIGTDRVLWEYETPSVKKVLITQRQIYILEPDLEQVTVTKNLGTQDLKAIYKNAKTLDAHTRQAVLDGKEVLIKDDGKFVTGLYYIDEVGNRAAISFRATAPFKFSQEDFKLQIPKHYEIIGE